MIAGDASLVRAIRLRAAVALNVITMIGIGPLITIPLVLGALHGPLSLVGWILGAVLALCDGLVWAELASLFPHSGGTYGFLLETFGRERLGRMLAFLFVWQTIFVAPLLLASGYIGFADYASYLFPSLHGTQQELLAMGVGVLTLAALYRRISSVAQIGTGLAVASVVALLCVIAAAYGHFSLHQALAMGAHDSLWQGLQAGLGQGLIIAMYDYMGYNASSCVGGEVAEPARTIPRSIVLSIGIVATLYVVMQFGVLGTVAWERVIPHTDGSLPALGQYLGSVIVAQRFGFVAAAIVTVLILVTAFASVYGNLLGYSRIPYAAAADGNFLAPFAHVHPKLRFPDVSLVVIGVLAITACFFTLGQVINALTAGIVLIQSVAQIVALFVLRARAVRAPYRMLLFPLPALLALGGWIWIFVSSGTASIVFGLVSLTIGVGVYFVSAAALRHWPFGDERPVA